MTAVLNSRHDEQRLTRLAALLSHPVRLRIISAMASGARESPVSLNKKFNDVDLGTWAYHMKKLRLGGVVELVEYRPRRGAFEHIYLLLPFEWDYLSAFIEAVINTAPTKETLDHRG